MGQLPLNIKLLVSKETFVLRRRASETLEFAIYQINKGILTAVALQTRHRCQFTSIDLTLINSQAAFERTLVAE